MAFAKHVFGGDPQGKPDYDFIPSAVFSSPPIANVGLTEEQAVEKHKNVDVFTSSYKCALPAHPTCPEIVPAGCAALSVHFAIPPAQEQCWPAALS